ncbi:hypothetical protein H6F90_00285 [Trichocoleus sp. FACHB-591]|uniref:hypothetical protein n=1 Tax=Trichocoleus sp. FACHB-591 TaxID=2692872 RepID=UPI0016898988|nr:hypothetical protein [Trichocoleus sp. FACHB-591]MBD2093592.1 hypothetical protein [Trichocoleus sp. FACHB-591]
MLLSKKFSMFAGVTSIVLGVTGVAQAESLLVGGPGYYGDCAPFGCVARYQQVYDASLFSGPANIDAISFFSSYSQAVDPANYTFSFSTTNKLVNELSSIFAENTGADSKTFFSGALGGPIGIEKLTISGGSFFYDPSKGNLLLDVAKAGSNNNFSAWFDYRSDFDKFSRVFSFEQSNEGSTNSNYGLVTEFTTSKPQQSESVPEPGMIGSLSLLGLGMIASGKKLAAQKSA